MKWKGSCIKPSLYCSVKSNKFHMLRRIPSAKSPELLSTDFIFCDGTHFPLRIKRNWTIGPHTFFNFWGSGRLQTQFCLLCFWSSFPIYILIPLGHSLFKREEIWVVFFSNFVGWYFIAIMEHDSHHVSANSFNYMNESLL